MGIYCGDHNTRIGRFPWLYTFGRAYKRTALTGRLKHFQKLGRPKGTNKEKGVRVNYDIGQVMSIASGMEMLQSGLTPERVVDELRDADGALSQGFCKAYAGRAEDDPIFYAFGPVRRA